MILTAITGSIGCGKTTISNLLREQGFLVYDVDKWVKYLYYDRHFLEAVRRFFPEAFKGSCLDKRKLRTIVFNDYDRLHILEGLVHPFLRKKLRKIIWQQSNNDDLVFIDAALLFEMGWNKYCDNVIVADVDYETQKIRVIKRDNISSADFERINQRQMPQREKVAQADFVIDTGVDRKKLKMLVIRLLEKL